MVACLSACDTFDFAEDRPAPPPVRQVDPTPQELPAASLELISYYEDVQQRQRTLGLLRTDGGGPDTPYDAARLSRTFNQIAFAREFTDAGRALIRQETGAKLHRWETPVRIAPIFGADVPEAQRADDTTAITRFAKRLNRATNHPVAMVERQANFHVMILTEEERQIAGPTLKRLIPGIREREIDLIENLNRATYCVVVASDPNDDGRLMRAVAVIRAELPPLLRMSCIHEEIAQGLGLANDSEQARPSIFNDDDEFGRLTSMDEKMLRMLYDLRLYPGISREVARPIVARMAQGLTGEAS